VGWFSTTSADGTLKHDRAFLHDGQQMVDLGSLDGTCSEAHAVNRAGTAVGGSCAGNRAMHAVVFHPGASIEDLTPDGYGMAEAISDSGYVVGRSGTDGFLRAPDGSMRNIGSLPGGTMSWLLGVNDGGIAVGTGYVPSYFAQGDTHQGEVGQAPRAAVWMRGRLWDLAYMTGRDDLRLYEAYAINGSGQIVVQGFLPDADGYAFLLTPR
jgi:probable HAF family extracellular repeat protein